MFDLMFTRINRYFCRLFSLWFLAVSAVVMFIIVLVDLTEYSRRSISTSKIQFNEIFELVLLKIPYHYQMILPFIVLISAIIAMSRLNRTNETIVARSFGISIWQMASGMLGVIILLSGFYLTVLNPLSAVLNQRHEKLEQKLFSGKDISFTLFEDGVWLRENYKDRQSIITISRINPQQNSFEKIQFQNFSPDFTFQSRIDAKEAIIKNGYWCLKDVVIYNAKKARETFATLELKTDLSYNKILNSDMDPKYLSFWRLPDYISLLDKSGLSSLPYRMYWHSLISKIGFMMSLVFLSAAFTQRPIRQGYTTLLIFLALATGLVLHFFSDIVYALGQIDKLPIIVAAWSPTVIVMLLSTTLILHLEEG